MNKPVNIVQALTSKQSPMGTTNNTESSAVMTGDQREPVTRRENPEGMHPGVIGGKRVFPKTNTCANSSLKKRLTRALAGIERHLEKNPTDSMAQARASKIKSAL